MVDTVETNDPGMIILNQTGDVAITWEDDKDLEVLTFIQNKINEGYTFFIIEDAFFKMKKRVKHLRNVNEIEDRKVYLADKEAERLVGLDKISVVKTYSGNVMGMDGKKLKTRKARDAQDVASSRSFAVQRAYGG